MELSMHDVLVVATTGCTYILVIRNDSTNDTSYMMGCMHS